MTKSNVKIKDNITIMDEINAIESIASSYFIDGEFTPYYSEMQCVIAIVENFIDGVEFESDELVYDTVIHDNEIYSLITKFYYDISDTEQAKKENEENIECITIWNRVMRYVHEKVEFEKQVRINKLSTDTLSNLVDSQNEMIESVIDVCTTLLDSFSALSNLKNLTQDDIELAKEFMGNLKDKNITETTLANAMKKVVKSHKVPNTKIYEEQRERIEEQQKQLEEKEKEIAELRHWRREHEVRNVLSDAKK